MNSLLYCVRITASFARRKHLPDDMNFLDEHDHRVAVFSKVLNARIRELLSEGLGTKVRQADPIFPEEGGEIFSGRRGENLDSWSIRVRLFSSSTVYSFLV